MNLFRRLFATCLCARLMILGSNATPGDLDLAFSPAVSGTSVVTSAVQPDGKIIIGGSFSSISGMARNNIARLNPDGTLDITFNPGLGTNSQVNCVAIQDDGKILIGGFFTTVNGQMRRHIARLLPDGAVEPLTTFSISDGGNTINAIVVQPDGRILIGGRFTDVGGTPRNRLARLNTNGTLESTATFNTGTGFDDEVTSLALQPDGRILAGGYFSTVSGQTRSRIARLNADGTLETASPFNTRSGPDAAVTSLAVQPDGRVLVGGSFASIKGATRVCIARLEPDGIVEGLSTFNPGSGANGYVACMCLQTDGKILITGNFSTVSGQARNGIARLNANGTLEATGSFNPPVPNDFRINSVVLQPDGAILLAGMFTTLGGQPRTFFARLANDIASQTITVPDSSRVHWLRGGAEPEIGQVTFELSTDGCVTWGPGGTTTRIAGGWETTGLSLPLNGAVRFRGRTAAGYGNGSSSFVEMIQAFPDGPEIVVEQPAVTILPDGESTNFGTVAQGSSSSRFYRIRNIGTQELAGLGITVDGPDASMFTVTAYPAPAISGPFGGSTFTVQFAPTSAGNKAAALHIASNDGDENPFDITLTGRDTTVDADLTNLVLSAGSLSPAFAVNTTTYTAIVPGATSSIAVTPTTSQAIAAVKVNGVTVLSNSASGALNLNAGSNLITITVTAGDGLTTKTYSITVIRPAAGLDPAFDPNVTGTLGYVYAIAVQPDGRILIGGHFGSVGGTTRSGIARLNADGNVDLSFNPGSGVNGYVRAVVLQADGKVLVGGGFSDINGQLLSMIARLNSDGTVDSAFNVGSGAAGGIVETLAVQRDGKILMGGQFTTVNGQPRQYLARLNADGTLESAAGFNLSGPPNNYIRTIAVQADGKIIIGGDFSAVNGQSRSCIARLNSDGTMENPATFPGPGIVAGGNGSANRAIHSVGIQADGRLVIGGNFTSLDGQTRNYVARLFPNGTLEDSTAFNTGTGADGIVKCVSVQTDGRILIAGDLFGFDGVSGRIARLNADGTVESAGTFSFGGSGPIDAVALQRDGKILIGGLFNVVGGQTRNHIARLVNTTATQSLAVPNSSRVEWTRGGTGPEADPVTFELSTDDGMSWAPLGFGTRVAGGWELAGLNLPSAGAIRARGRTRDGHSSSGMVELVTSFPEGPEIIVQQPAGTHVPDGGNRSFPAIDVGTNTSLTFTIKSIGTIDLTGLTVSIDGPDAGQFAVTSHPKTPLTPPFGTTTFTVRFAPASVGVKTATLHIASNDADENPFDITLTGAGKSLDPAFNPNVSGQQVVAMAVQPDGKILLGGNFSSVGGQTRPHLARLLADGTPESTATFDAGTGPDGQVGCIAVQPDGKILIGGLFSTVNGEPRSRIARLYANGSLENTATFDPGVGVSGLSVQSIAVQPDGKILIAGDFSSVGGQPRNHYARLNPDGSVESTATFNTSSGANEAVYSVALQPDGKILLGGRFTVVRDQARNCLARLHADGTLESITTFEPFINSNVNCIAVQPDGKILIGGVFTSVGNRIARLHQSGGVENTATFDAGLGANADVYSLALQADGRIVVGGGFNLVNNQPRSGVARLNANGTVENTVSFNPGAGASDTVYSVALQADGKILAGGLFTSMSGASRNKVARFGNQTAIQTLSIPGSGRVEWSRGGTAPEIDQVRFEFSTTGAAWSDLGSGVRMAGGWERPGLSLPSIGLIRARGRSAGGFLNGSAGLVEQVQIFANAPVVTTSPVAPPTATTATLNGTVVPNGEAEYFFQYGFTAGYGSTTQPQDVSGPAMVSAMAALTGLTGNAVYHCRLLATNDAGTVYGNDVVFMTEPDPPLTVTGTPAAVTSTSATLLGSVNPKGREVSAWFEYGLTTLYGSSTSIQTIPVGVNAVNVLAPVANLMPNTSYHFRLVSTSTGGNSAGDDRTFTTAYPPPQVTTGSAESLSTTSVRVHGSVRAFDTVTEVFFDLGTDGLSFPTSIAAAPAQVNGDAETPVSAVLTNLSQGITYHYRVRASSAGGPTAGTPATFSMAILSGLQQIFPGVPPAADGAVFVTVSPSGIGAGWRFVGEQTWRVPTSVAGGLTTGDRVIEFRPVPGYIQPPPELLAVVSGEEAVSFHGVYVTTAGAGSGELSVTLKPDSVAAESRPVEIRAQWRLLGESDAQWRNSGSTITGLVPGGYVVECKAVPDKATPPLTSILVENGRRSDYIATYYFADILTGTPPSVLSFETVSGDQTRPFAWIGQLRSQSGSATGFVVKPRVVATAAHVVWNDGTLAAEPWLQWLFQRHRNNYEPKPQIPRGFYMMDGYAAQRKADNSPGTSSQESQHLDVAALYFTEDAGRAGIDSNGQPAPSFGGFLASDLSVNEFLTSSSLKILAGYPVNGIPATNQGRMHATPPANVTFDPEFGRTWKTSNIRTSGGNSGGPLCVQYHDGSYYPAAIYLGGTGETVVRAIDSDIVDLFNRAESTAHAGGNSTGGGISLTTFIPPGGVDVGGSGKGALRVRIVPPSAITAGAAWKFSNDDPAPPWRRAFNDPAPPGSWMVAGLSQGNRTLLFRPVVLNQNYFVPPGTGPTEIQANMIGEVTYTYAYTIDGWRKDILSSDSNTGSAANNADPDEDGLENLVEFAFGLNPIVADAAQLPLWRRVGDNLVLLFTQPISVGGVSSVAEESPTMVPGSWTLVPDTGLAPNHLFSVPATSAARKFLRLRVTIP